MSMAGHMNGDGVNNTSASTSPSSTPEVMAAVRYNLTTPQVTPDSANCTFWDGSHSSDEDSSEEDSADEDELNNRANLANMIDADYFLPHDDSSEDEQFQAAIKRASTLGYMYESGIADDNARQSLENDAAVRHVLGEIESDGHEAVTSSNILNAPASQRLTHDQHPPAQWSAKCQELKAGLKRAMLGMQASMQGPKSVRRARAAGLQNTTNDSVFERNRLLDSLERVRGARVSRRPRVWVLERPNARDAL